MRFFPPAAGTSNNLKGIGLIFYCKDCEKIVDVIPVGRKFVYKCAICKTKNVAFGTDKSIRNFFRLPEEDKTAPAVTEPVAAPASVAPAPVTPIIPTAPAVAQNPTVQNPAPAPTQSIPHPAPKVEPIPVQKSRTYADS
jgi:hypothetical protein